MFDAFMKFDGIKGESLDARHKGEIDVVKFNWAAAQNTSWATGGGGGSGKASVQDFQFTHQYDLASPLLFKQCVTGTHIKEANFTVRRVSSVDSGIPDFLKIKFTDVLISRVNPHGNTVQNEGMIGEKGNYGSPIGTTIVGGYNAVDPSLTHTYGDELPLEDVSLSFAKVEITYQPLDPAGRPQGGPTVVSWDIKGNTGPGEYRCDVNEVTGPAGAGPRRCGNSATTSVCDPEFGNSRVQRSEPIAFDASGLGAQDHGHGEQAECIHTYPYLRLQPHENVWGPRRADRLIRAGVRRSGIHAARAAVISKQQH